MLKKKNPFVVYNGRGHWGCQVLNRVGLFYGRDPAVNLGLMGQDSVRDSTEQVKLEPLILSALPELSSRDQGINSYCCHSHTWIVNSSRSKSSIQL